MRKLHGFRQGVGCGVLWITHALAPQSSFAADGATTALGQVKAGTSQPRLEVRRTGASVQAVACARACDWNNAAQWTLEAPFDTGTASFAALDLGSGRHAAHVVVRAEERRFELVIVAPLTTPAASGAAPTQPTAMFAGETGLATGEAPDRTGEVVEVLPAKGNTVSVVIGAVQEDVSLCGRRALLSPRLLHPDTLSLKGIKLQRLPGAERESATQLVATRVAGRVSSNIFTPLVASSGKGSPAALVDDDPQTVWTENRGGSGGGEFVVFRAPESMGLTGLTFTTPSNPAPGYRAPKSFWVATTHAVYRVELPNAASAATAPTTATTTATTTARTTARTTATSPVGSEPTSSSDEEPSAEVSPVAAPNDSELAASDTGSTADVTAGATGTEWHVAFPNPIQTSCLAISLDTAEPNDGAIDVGFAEVAATTDVDESRLATALSDLDTGGDRAAAAEQLLQAVGKAAFDRVQKRYRGYSEAGRMRALNVMDSAPCRHSVGTYVQALYNEGSAEAEHGAQGLARCRAQAVPALARRLPALASGRTRLVTNVLVRLDPVTAVDAMAPLLSGGSRAKRRVLQLAFSSALADPKAAERARVLLGDAQLEPRAALFLMRALGNRVVNYADIAAPRLRSLLRGANFDVRYLALSPAAQLAGKDAELQRFLLDSLARAKEPAIRTEAARVLLTSPAGQGQGALIAAIGDPHVRVREAAVTSAGEQTLAAARNALHQRIEDDAWPFVRSAAVRALGQLSPSADSAKLLAQVAESDDAPSVRRPAVHVLGIQNARSTLPSVRDVFTEDEDPDVRATAAASLGLMCDRSMTDVLTRKAFDFARLTSSESERLVGKASLTALGRLAPPDLEQRLAPFFVKGVPQIAQSAAYAALQHPEPCPKP